MSRWGGCVLFLATAVLAEDPELLQLRRAQAAELDALRAQYESASSRPGSNADALLRDYQARARQIRQKYNALDPRAAQVRPLTEMPGHKITSTGGSREPVPANVNADIDLASQARTPGARAAADAAAREHLSRGGPVQETPSKIVDPRTDTTYWKQDTPEAQRAKLNDPDAFKTEGGRAATGNQGAVRDARGEYLDHRSKFEAARESGDLKTGGKSVVKAGSSEAVGPRVIKTDDPALAERFRKGEVTAREFQQLQEQQKVEIGRSDAWQKRNPEAQQLYDQSKGLKNYQDTHEAGITRLEQTPAQQQSAVQKYLRDAGREMDAIGERAAQKGALRDSIRADLQRGYESSADPAVQRVAGEVAAERARVESSNTAAAQKLEQARQKPSAEQTYERGWKEGQDPHGGAGAATAAAPAEPGLLDRVKSGARAADEAVAGAMGVTALPAGASGARQALNVAGEKALQAAGYAGSAYAVYQTGKDSYEGGKAAGEGIKALMEGDTEKAAQKFGEAADKGKDVGLAVGLTAAAQAMPQTAAMAGAGMAGYAGGRYALENTEIGRQVDQGAENFMDRGMQAAEGLSDALGGLAGRPTQYDMDRSQLDRRQQAYLGALERGEIRLRDGVTADELMDKVKYSEREFGSAADPRYRSAIAELVEAVPREPGPPADAGDRVEDLTRRIQDPRTPQKEKEELQAQLLGELRTLQQYAAEHDRKNQEQESPAPPPDPPVPGTDEPGGEGEPGSIAADGAGGDPGDERNPDDRLDDMINDPDRIWVPGLGLGFPIPVTHDALRDHYTQRIMTGEITPEQAIQEIQELGQFNRTMSSAYQEAEQRGDLPPGAPSRPTADDLRGAEVSWGGGDGGSDAGAPPARTSGVWADFFDHRADSTDRSGEYEIIGHVSSVAEASTSGDRQQQEAQQTRNAGGAAASDIVRQAAGDVAAGDRAQSWGNRMGDAVADGIKTGATQAATALGQAASQEASGAIFGGRPSAGGSSTPASGGPVRTAGSASGDRTRGDHRHPDRTGGSTSRPSSGSSSTPAVTVSPPKPPAVAPTPPSRPPPARVCPNCGGPMVFCADGQWHCLRSAYVMNNPGAVRRPPASAPPVVK